MYSMVSKKNPTIKYSLLAILFWATAYLPTKILLSQNLLSLEEIYTLRYIIGAAILLICIPIFRMQIPHFTDLITFSVAGGLGITLYIFLFQQGSSYISPFVMPIINALCPLITVIFGFLIFRDRVNLKGKFGLLLIIIGVGLIFFFSEYFSLNIGLLYMLGATCSFSFYSVLQKLIVKKYRPVEALAYSFIMGTIFITAINYPTVDINKIKEITPIMWVYIGYLVIVPGILAYYFWIKAIELCKYTVDVVNIMGILPVIGVLLSFVGLGEKFSYFMIGGMLLIILGMLIFSKRSNRNY